MNRRGQFEMEVTPLGVLFGLVGAGVGIFTVWSMSAGGFMGDGGYNVGIIWKILTPIVTGGVCFFIGNKMSE